MDQKWMVALVILGFYQKVTSGAYHVETPSEGQSVDIKCNPDIKGSMVIWFRIVHKTEMQFIASFTNSGLLKTVNPLLSFDYSKMEVQNILTLRSFKGDEDAGIYGCGSLVAGNKLHFGVVTQLNAREAPKQKPTVATTPTPSRVVPTTTPCICPMIRETNPSMSCPLLILAPLAGGCGFLLLLLIIITLYCNKIRTRRCPHHYKRKRMEPGKQMIPNSNI